jgi:hypothetical protein
MHSGPEIALAVVPTIEKAGVVEGGDMLMAKAQELLYAVVGAGDFAVEKAKRLSDPQQSTKVYKDLVKRGRTLSTKIKSAAPTKRAIEQTRTARSQAKAAATSATKAVRANAKAARSATTKTSKAG